MILFQAEKDAVIKMNIIRNIGSNDTLNAVIDNYLKMIDYDL